MKVVVVGINHSHQFSVITMDSVSPNAARVEREQKQLFRDRIRQLIAQHRAQLVGEEVDSASLVERRVIASQNDVIAYDVARECNVRYEEIDMTVEEREKKDIPTNGYSTEDPMFSAEQTASWNKERERVMVEKTCKKATSLDVVLLVCGRDHMNGLAQLFCDARHDVQRFDVTSEDWFIDPYNWEP